MKIPKECEKCFYQKVRDADPETKELTWGPFCLKTGAPMLCEVAANGCELHQYINVRQHWRGINHDREKRNDGQV